MAAARTRTHTPVRGFSAALLSTLVGMLLVAGCSSFGGPSPETRLTPSAVSSSTVPSSSTVASSSPSPTDASPSSSASTSKPTDASLTRLDSPNPGSVNTYLVPTTHGVVVVDTGRNVAGGRRVVDAVKKAGRTVLAVLVTHAHPDHIGGLGEIHSAFPDAPVYASAATITAMHEDPLKLYPLARRDDKDFPDHLTYPDHPVDKGATLQIDGASWETAQFGAGESSTSTAYYDSADRRLFAGDLTDDHATPALLEAHSCGWLTNLEKLQKQFPKAETIYPGHGAPGKPDKQVKAQGTYLERIRTLVHTAMTSRSPKGARVVSREKKAIVKVMNREFRDYPPVAALPDLLAADVDAVAKEMSNEKAADLPKVCQT